MDPRGFFAAALVAASLVGCSDAEPTAQSADAVELGSVKRLFGTLVDKMTDLITREPLTVAQEPGADWQPPLYAFGEEPAKSFDGAIIGTRPGDPMAEQGCVYLTEPGFFAPQATVDNLVDFALHDGSGEPVDDELYVFVNGVLNGPEDHCETLKHYAASRPGHAIVGVFNASTYLGVGDFIQAGLDRFSVQAEHKLAEYGIDTLTNVHKNRAASSLANLMVQRMSNDRPMRIMAHSQGGAITSLALHHALPRLVGSGVLHETADGYEFDSYAPELRIITMGSAAPQWPAIVDTSLQSEFGGEATFKHAVHVRDATPAAMGVNAWNWSANGGERSGAEFAMVFYDSQDNGAWETLHTLSKDFRAMEAGVKIWMFSTPNGTWEGDVADAELAVPDVSFSELRPTSFHSALDYITAVWHPPPFNGPTCRWVETAQYEGHMECDEGCTFDYENEKTVCEPR